MSVTLIILLALGYLLILFVIAYIGDRRSEAGRSLIRSPLIYALSLAVFCTAWTYFGSIGRAAEAGPVFLPVYLGPLILAPLWAILFRKMILISKHQRITSIADFISARYGKSFRLGFVVSFMALVGVVPYVSIQLKAISLSFDLLIDRPAIQTYASGTVPILTDSALYVAAILAVFTILFGTRHIDPQERHEGLVLSVAFESLVKLGVFLVAGILILWQMRDPSGSVFVRAAADSDLRSLFILPQGGSPYWDWSVILVLSMAASLLLPRQFHIGVVESTDVRFVTRAAWLFPLYLLLINLFVLPIALAGRLTFAGQAVDPDTYILMLPKVLEMDWLALLVFLGGLSAASGMVIVSVIALSIMVSNHILMPILFRGRMDFPGDLYRHLLGFRRLAIVLVLFLAYGYFRMVGHSYGLVSVGLISFAAIAQFAPAIVGGMYWKRANASGALWGLVGGFVVWAYTLPFPMLLESSGDTWGILSQGPWGVSWLRPRALLGLTDLSPVSHSVFWSLLINVGLFALVSLRSRSGPAELSQADVFVNIYKYIGGEWVGAVRRRSAPRSELRRLLSRFVGADRAHELIAQFIAKKGDTGLGPDLAGPDLVEFAETQIAGAIGAASAKVLVHSIAKEDPISVEELLRLLDSTQETLQQAQEIEVMNQQLREQTKALEEANANLRQLDKMKADFVATVSHELRTPLTSIRSFAQILGSDRPLTSDQRSHFLTIIAEESDRISRLVDQVLDLDRLDRQTNLTPLLPVNLEQVAMDALRAWNIRCDDQGIQLQVDLIPVRIQGQPDQLHQVFDNLLANAFKFCAQPNGEIRVSMTRSKDEVHIQVVDNGAGIPPDDRDVVFGRFVQLPQERGDKPRGSGLGLAITRKIVTRHGGQIVLVDHPILTGACFRITLPIDNGDGREKL